jgi:hypothetical protein
MTKVVVGLAPALLCCLSPALAGNIGTAISVKTEAAIEQPGETRVLTVGAGVSQAATVHTDPAGSAQLKFIDETLLVIGPSSSIKLDNVLFNPDRRAKTFVLEAIAGAFRFTTGKSNHDAYAIQTPVATIGVRGTRFAFGIRGDEVTIVVTQGTVTSCPRGAPAGAARCVEASAGNTIVSTPAGAIVRRTLGAIPDQIRTVLALPAGPNRQLPDLRDAMRGVQPLNRPVQGLGGALPSTNPTATIPSGPSLGRGLENPGGGLPGIGGLPNAAGALPNVGGGVAPRLPGLGR